MPVNKIPSVPVGTLTVCEHVNSPVSNVSMCYISPWSLVMCWTGSWLDESLVRRVLGWTGLWLDRSLVVRVLGWMGSW